MQIKSKEIKTGNEENTCTICKNYRDKGIRIGRTLICSQCENRIINIEVESVEYEFYKNKIREAFSTMAI